MEEHEQEFLIAICKVCSKEKVRISYFKEEERLVARKFVTNAQHPEMAICTHCGFTIERNKLKEIME